MNFKTSMLASAVLASLAAVQVQAATPPTLITQVFGTGTSSAVFAGGATINGGANFLTTIPADQKPGILATLTPAAADVGQEADFFMVANAGDAWFMRTATGFIPWDGMVPNLVPFATKTLQANEVVQIADLEAFSGYNLDGLSLNMFVGYMTDSSPLVYSGAIPFSVATPPADTCPVGPAAGFAPAVPGGKNLCVISGTLTSSVQLTSNFDYVLSGAVFVGGDNVNNAALTIDAGTTIYGESGADFLVITRGSKLHVNGSPDAPVIMTSANDADATAETRGQWGGLIINGNAPINGCSVGTALCEAEGEGSTGLYGGNNPDDSSGNLNYLQVKYAGFEITPDNELNGIAFQGVGRGTLVDYVQVHNNTDDGVEFFGGAVNAKHIYLSGIGDDSLDWVLGWNGKMQHVVVVQTDRGDQGIEADNNSSNRDSLPRSHPTIANMTMIGNANTDLGMLLREGTAGNLSNFVVVGFGDGCIDIDHSATFVNAGSSATNLSGNLTMTNSAVDCAVNFVNAVDDNFSVATWFNSQAGNAEVDTGMESTYINSAAVNARPAKVQNDPWFDQTDYIGAVKDVASDWTAGWTYKD